MFQGPSFWVSMLVFRGVYVWTAIKCFLIWQGHTLKQHWYNTPPKFNVSPLPVGIASFRNAAGQFTKKVKMRLEGGKLKIIGTPKLGQNNAFRTLRWHIMVYHGGYCVPSWYNYVLKSSANLATLTWNLLVESCWIGTHDKGSLAPN